jgi:hypothetical protein
MTDRPAGRTALAAVGAAAVLGSALLFLAPGAVGGVATVEAVARSTAFSEEAARAVVFGLVGLGCLLWIVAAPESADDDADTTFPTVEPRGEDGSTVGSGFDRNLAAALSAAAEGRDGDEIRADLRAVAADAVAAAEGCSRRAARERVADGAWTDDRVAAAYLADEGALSLGRRLRSRLRPRRRKRRRVERTVRAIEALLADGGTP